MLKQDDLTLELSDLRCFVLAAEHKSLTAAAASDGVAQSVFSRHMARLESVLGGRLFHRTGRGVTLSELGVRVLPRAKALVSEARALTDDATGRWHRPVGVVDVGLLPSLTTPLASQLFIHIRENFPEIDLRLHEAYSGEVQAMLAEGKIDVGLLNHYRPRRRELQDAVMTSEMCLIVRPDVPVARDKMIRFAAIAALPLVMPLKPNSMRGVIEDIAQRKGLSLSVAMEVSSSTAMKEAVRCGLAATLPPHAVKEEVSRGDFCALPITDPTIRQTTFVDTTRRRPISAAVREVEKALRVLVSNLQEH